MKKLFLLLIFVLLFNVFAPAQNEKEIEKIRRIYRETNEKISEAEKNFGDSDVFLTELVVNKGETPYPAVGVFREKISFYYGFGDRAENPYPDRLLKIKTETRRSARAEYSEAVYDPGGQLIFYFEKRDAGEEKRFYFAGGKLIRYQTGDRISDISNAKEDLRLILERQKKLVNVFKNSLE